MEDGRTKNEKKKYGKKSEGTKKKRNKTSKKATIRRNGEWNKVRRITLNYGNKRVSNFF
jgi:hypothetical protein